MYLFRKNRLKLQPPQLFEIAMQKNTVRSEDMMKISVCKSYQRVIFEKIFFLIVCKKVIG
ncbi:hypothetical protein C7B79_16505 [Chroococcidiopsis cubana CCALA 043]|nr:hypothetical protein C7B79_16505 [Chroococcidiopsis cubana CCALA 043]